MLPLHLFALDFIIKLNCEPLEGLSYKNESDLKGILIMKQTLQIGRKTIRCDFGFILILIVLFMTSCFAIYNSFNLIRNGSGSYYLRRQIMWYAVGFATLILISRFQNKAGSGSSLFCFEAPPDSLVFSPP